MTQKQPNTADGNVPVVFTVNQNDKNYWVLLSCPAEKIDDLNRAYSNMINSDEEVDLQSALDALNVKVMNVGETEELIENGRVIGHIIPDHIKQAAKHIIGHDQDDPALPHHPDQYMPPPALEK